MHDNSFTHQGLVCIDESASKKLNGVSVERLDVLINITGDSILRTCLAPASVLPARVNQHVSIIRSDGTLPQEFILLTLLRKESKDWLLSMDAGATRKAITKGHLERFPILVPPGELLSNFASTVRPLFQRAECSGIENRTLAELRDTLLPKLISGELRVPEAEKTVEEVA